MHFSKEILKWHQEIDRLLPWKETKDPYKIWISEIIMQQTRVSQGWDYYKRFIEVFPTVHHVARATEDEILQQWQGLGYYSRARNIHKAAQTIVLEHEGNFPKEYKQVLSLSGIGPYTAAAICSFAYEKVYAVVDGNVYRVLSRYFGVRTPIDSSSGKKEIQELAQKLIPQGNPGNYNQAIMDFGALVCTPKNTKCQECPLKESCCAFEKDLVKTLPIKEKKLTRKTRYFNFFIINFKGDYFIEKRRNKDIWRGLYQFPLIETEQERSIESGQEIFSKVLPSTVIYQIIEIDKEVQKLTHQTIIAKFIHITVNEEIQGFIRETIDKLSRYAFPIMLQKQIKKITKKNSSAKIK